MPAYKRYLKYPLSINKDKYPDIYNMLMYQKENNGIAFYVRDLIMQDIERKAKNKELPFEKNKQKAIDYSVQNDFMNFEELDFDRIIEPAEEEVIAEHENKIKDYHNVLDAKKEVEEETDQDDVDDELNKTGGISI